MAGNCCWHVLFLCCTGVYFIIGLPMWLVGCNPDLPDGCITREIQNGNVTGVNVASGICCSSCKCGKSTCCCGGYSCYSSSLGIDTSVGHCNADVNGVYHSSSDARNAGTSVGLHPRTVIDPRTKLCTIYLKDSWNIWIAGICFMVFAATCTVGWIVYIIATRDCVQDCRKSSGTTSSTNPSHNISNIELDAGATNYTVNVSNNSDPYGQTSTNNLNSTGTTVTISDTTDNDMGREISGKRDDDAPPGYSNDDAPPPYQ